MAKKKPKKRIRKSPSARPLTDKQRRWAAEYPVDYNGTQAAIRAGYSPKTAHRAAQHNLHHPRLMKEAERLTREAVERATATVERVILEKQRIAYADIAEIFDDKNTLVPPSEIPKEVRLAISSIKVKERWVKTGDGDTEKVVTYEYKFWDKVRALELLGRYLDMYTGKGDAPTVVFLGAEEIEKEPGAGT